MKKKLPIGIQAFSVLREEDYLYIDKTEFIYKMKSSGKVYFLSRPRRFGKSLLVSTLDELFSGRKELFEGLYIYDKWDWTKQFPVIRIDWTRINHSTPDEMKNGMCRYLRNIALRYQITIKGDTPIDCFDELIFTLNRTTKQKVVILIDEYDKPITSHLNSVHFEVMRDDVHNFYQVMKGSDDAIEFIFITGVSKFSGLAVFSALNNPEDITMDSDYAAICGYTQEELESYFADYFDDLTENINMNRNEVLDEIKVWYNGYSWDGKTPIYNPVSTLLLFKKRDFSNYWFDTGTPTFLIDMLQKRNQIESILKPVETDASTFGSYDPANISEIALLFQTGYLTIKNVATIDKEKKYTLDIPNMEVRESFTRRLLHAYSNYPLDKIHKLTREMHRQIGVGDSAGFDQNLRMLLANIPNILHKDNEGYYHSLFMLAMKMLGFEIQGEVMTNIGRIDAVMHQQDMIVIAEIKYSAKKSLSKLLKAAMKQIYDNKYYEAYLDRRIMLMAVAFTGKEVKCEMKMYK
jgi:hypothetical protein